MGGGGVGSVSGGEMEKNPAWKTGKKTDHNTGDLVGSEGSRLSSPAAGGGLPEKRDRSYSESKGPPSIGPAPSSVQQRCLYSFFNNPCQ